jgi:hypothetical protein
MSLNPLVDTVVGVFGKVTDVISHLTVSGEDKAALQKVVIEGQLQAAQAITDFASKLLDAQTTIIAAEAKSESWIARNWRPITMLTFLALIVDSWILGPPKNMPPEMVNTLFEIIKLGLAGYVVGRSVEKTAGPIVSALVSSMKSKEIEK